MWRKRREVLRRQQWRICQWWHQWRISWRWCRHGNATGCGELLCREDPAFFLAPLLPHLVACEAQDDEDREEGLYHDDKEDRHWLRHEHGVPHLFRASLSFGPLRQEFLRIESRVNGQSRCVMDCFLRELL
ncbi:hypothetical protein NL676_009112 [Syzygium grande]|nr:hypothetical protein NL676_009112 [Syzygium grande]